MSVDGTWNLVIKSPMGDQTGVLAFKAEGDALTGTATTMGSTDPIAGGKVDGDTVTWSNKITSPFPMTLEFTGTLDGDSLSGTVKAGTFGTYPFTGARA